MAEAREYRWTEFLVPRYWPSWLALVFLRAVAALPLGITASAGLAKKNGGARSVNPISRECSG